MGNIIGKVYESTTQAISVKLDFKSFEGNKDNLKVGKHLKINLGNHDYVIVSITGIKAFNDGSNKESYLMIVESVGSVVQGNFNSGSSVLPSPTENVEIAGLDVLSLIFSSDGKYNFPMGNLVQNEDVTISVNGNSFFGKHMAIVGSTGSGKSCTVAKILQNAVGISDGANVNRELKNSHILIFDIHSEYKSAFSVEDGIFSLNLLDVEKMKLPYWLMNSEELESLFIESNELNSHNQISQFRNAVVENKKKYNPSLTKITYDTPVYFSIQEVFNYIFNMNNEVINKVDGTNFNPFIINENEERTEITNRNKYFDSRFRFISPSTAKADKASNGAFNGEFNRFIARLENKINDNRLSFIMSPLKENQEEYKTIDFPDILKQFLGYMNKANVTIIDLSGIPFEVLSITISLVSRLIFDFAFHYSKLLHEHDQTNNIPFLVVCEEAHNYIPQKGGATYKASKKSIERIAKEGRKYGLSLMVVSQRPSEVSDTIFAQCNNFVALKLTNTTDQSYIKNLLPNNTNSIADILPTLSPGRALLVGDAVPIPALIKMAKPNPMPKSENVKVHDSWNENWHLLEAEGEEQLEVTIQDVLDRWSS